ncbi:PP2C family protein-serine/threonine phosphatase [Oceanibacterium hippocampi]|uniref:PP2C family protein-serine/threonine phosphatase n=1 Tax=Oceanibacterium hippocampi TaxID=745714 RepID=UPI0015941162|nr:protein phosphatase 2C domain-containing protein [Oceanibacterium hippocampi]
MRFKYATASEAGPRTVNEDAIGVWREGEDKLAVAIADGLGGYQGGQQAADLSIRMFGSAIGRGADFDIKNIAFAINGAIRREQEANPEFRGMATTLSAAVCGDGRVDFVHCGDTRIVLQRHNGIRRLTVDHTEAQRLFDLGVITRQEFSNYPRKNVLESALGISDSPRVDIGQQEILSGDRMFVMSDGIHSKVYLREIRDISVRSREPSEAVRDIVDLVSARGPEDNFSIVAIFID